MSESLKESLQKSIAEQRSALIELMRAPLARLAENCRAVWGDREALDSLLGEALPGIPHCKFLYVLGLDGIQISDNLSREGAIRKDFGRDRSQRPYVKQMVPEQEFLLSEAYISLRARRPSLTAMQTVRDKNGQPCGYIGADFDLRDLPLTRELYEEPTVWRQIKGDPAIRGTVFHQSRSDSQMDIHIDTVLSVLEELMLEHGVFHGKLHFSSNRATIWLMDDPYRYRLLDIDMLTDPDICLAYPRCEYPENSLVPKKKIRAILEGFRELRFMDETFYLRSGSINIFNGMVSLTFSCDGSHYIPWDAFLNREHAFWVASPTAKQAQ